MAGSLSAPEAFVKAAVCCFGGKKGKKRILLTQEVTA
jgi:hypothetical protein